MIQLSTTSATTSGTHTTVTKRLLTCGAVAGPLFVVVSLLQALTRDGFDLRYHPLSLLSLGDLGWLQIATFVTSGLLYVAGAVGMRRAIRTGRGRTWGPLLIGIFGVCLVWGGVFIADPADGFPQGATEGDPTWHGLLHSIAPALAFLVLAAACFVFARRFASRRQRGWAAYSAATGVALFVPDAFFNQAWFSLVLTLAAVVGWGWASVVAARLRTELPAGTT